MSIEVNLMRLNLITKKHQLYNAAQLSGENSFTTCDKTNKGMNEQINDPITLADTQIHRLCGERWHANPFRRS